jgi:protein-S-isoprenylcysteine O-methyltransferase Ste14
VNKLMPTTWLLIALLVVLVLRFLLPGPGILPVPWNVIGILPIVVGVWINLAADRAIHQAGTTVKPHEQPTAMIQSGVYAFSRNPMYLGFAVIVLGVALVLNAWVPLVVLPAFVILLDVMFIRVEELNLAHRFTGEWQKYRQRVHRWI